MKPSISEVIQAGSSLQINPPDIPVRKKSPIRIEVISDVIGRIEKQKMDVKIESEYQPEKLYPANGAGLVRCVRIKIYHIPINRAASVTIKIDGMWLIGFTGC